MPKIDEPEPRWQVILAIVSVVGIHLALPESLIFGPPWLLPAVVVALLVPTVFAHRAGRNHLNHFLGILICTVLTAGLMMSISLLAMSLPEKTRPALTLLRAGGILWLTNVLVFALWYWRLDGDGPNERASKAGFGSTSFVFPQMQVEKSERKNFGISQWRPSFIDYLFIAFTNSSTFGPTDAPILAPWAKILSMIQSLLSLAIMVLLISRAVGVL
jgi:hypothetical protein